MVIRSSTNEHYSYYLHFHLASGGFSGFEDDTVEQTGITLTGTTSTAYVYWYPKDEDTRPLLIDTQGSSTSWYQRRYLDSNEWDPVKDPPTRIGTETKILPQGNEPTGLSVEAKVGIGIGTGLGGAGLGGLIGVVAWKWPSIVSFIIARL
ncbi:hypothetical protein BEWA_049520 [Theileria equi strain WA]|uniref:Uncharacterized protein n=1 Tax=Theileria equi strain WA TaxID=1537102 RepID=L1LB32_THEEQ|nr:hypothetical protein BEWA_049520 [Theileria equi strain WA]EKX72485.1 hypothetical protein BEWA_049520 [Theileria equi strain WA]|eukprot:XP_004831937.1 hypothetical protein BEWA_049520 [Theileria equi strain WA]